MARLMLPALAVLALVLTAQATPAVHSGTVAGIPGNLHAFLLRSDEPVVHDYSRTPSFTWLPVKQPGGHYQFQIATSRSFQDGTIVFKDMSVAQPAETVPRQLPWMTGQPYALWARVRWISTNGQSATQWSKMFGFNIQWAAKEVPAQLPAPEGLVRWAPIDGATAYEVLYPDLVPAASFETTTNVADEREFFTFHNALGNTPIHWRVRAIRDVGQFASSTNGLPAVSYGPWSPLFTSVNAPQTNGTLHPTDTVSDVWDKAGKAGSAHQLTPGFAWTPSAPIVSEGIQPGSGLYRVYIFSDKSCVNRVFTGSIVGSPAWAPRSVGGPMPLPGDTTTLGQDQTAPPYLTGPGSEGSAVDATGATVVSNETAGSHVGASGAATASSGSATASAGVDLWDSGWPSGRFYWTVVPVSIELSKLPQTVGGSTASSGSSGSSSGSSGSSSGSSGSSSATSAAITYHDMAVPQDSCQSGLGMSFGKVSEPVVTAAGKPFLSGVGPTGRTIAATGPSPSVFASPIAAWQPVIGASKYQIEMSRTLYPWHAGKHVGTPATSVVLPVTKFDIGVWYYRVRGVNLSLPKGAQAMAWSTPIKVKVTGNRIAILK